ISCKQIKDRRSTIGSSNPKAMVEIVALVIALSCLIGNSPVWAGFFVLVALVAAAWRAYKGRENTARIQTELQALRGELQRTTTLAERAVRIAAETANELSTVKRYGFAQSGTETSPASTRPPVAPETVTSKPVEVTPNREEVPVSSATVKAPPPVAPKVS